MTDRWHLMALRYNGQTLIDASHDAVEARDHAAIRDIIRAAWQAGRDSAQGPVQGVGYPRWYRDGIGGMGE